MNRRDGWLARGWLTIKLVRLLVKSCAWFVHRSNFHINGMERIREMELCHVNRKTIRNKITNPDHP